MTQERMLITLPPELAAAVRRKSKETGVPVSVAVQRFLAVWVETGELPPLPKGGGQAKRKK